MKNEGKIISFTDLLVWQKGHQLVLDVYKITRSFPKDELFGLVSQMRRAAVSVTSNIAEGFSKYSIKEKTQFYNTSLASLHEIQNQLLIAKDIGYLELIIFQDLAKLSIEIQKMLRKLIQSCSSYSR